MSGRQYLVAIAAVCALGTLPPEAAHASEAPGLKTCPRPLAAAQQRVRNFLAAGHLAGVREQLGLSGIAPDRVRELGSHSEDAVTCGKLQDALQAVRDGHAPPGQAAFFEAGGFYFVAISHPSPQSPSGNVIHEGSSQIYVFDNGFRLITRLMA